MDKIKTYKQKVKKNPDDADAHYNLDANLHFKDRASAFEGYKKLKELDSELADKLFDLIYKEEEELEGEDYDKIESNKQAIRIGPDYADAHYNLGAAYYDLGKYEDAIESYKQAIRIDPDDAKAHYNLGLAYLLLNDRGSALEQYKILKKLDTELANELFNEIYK